MEALAEDFLQASVSKVTTEIVLPVIFWDFLLNGFTQRNF